VAAGHQIRHFRALLVQAVERIFPVPRILFIWDSNGGPLGHLGYLWGKLQGRSCALCDLSYAGLRPSAEFEACQTSSQVPIVAQYRDELSASVAEAVGGAFPSVVLESEDGVRVLFGPKEIAEFDDFTALETALQDAAAGA
jgi:hypothetical protein